MSTFGPAYDPRLDGVRLRTQLAVIREVMLAAAGCNPEASRWYTLRELAEITGYGEASISAQLRHLRKPQFGGYVVEKRRRPEGLRAAGVWEYRLRLPARGGSSGGTARLFPAPSRDAGEEPGRPATAGFSHRSRGGTSEPALGGLRPPNTAKEPTDAEASD